MKQLDISPEKPLSGEAILGIGAIMVDQVFRVPKLPSSGEGVVVQERSMSMGGCAFNSTNTIRLLGGSYFLFAPLGTGPISDEARKELASRNMSAVEVSTDFDNATCLCLVEGNGERTMITLPGIERHYEPSWFESIDANDFGYALIVGYEIDGAGGDAIIGFLEAHPHLKVFYNPGPMISQVNHDKTSRINKLSPIWHINALEAISYTGCTTLEKAGFAVAEQTGNTVVITDGANGSHLFHEAVHSLIPGVSAQVADTVGAGDTHLGALVASLAGGLSWEKSLLLANRMAAAVCEVNGSTLSDEQYESIKSEILA